MRIQEQCAPEFYNDVWQKSLFYFSRMISQDLIIASFIHHKSHFKPFLSYLSCIFQHHFQCKKVCTILDKIEYMILYFKLRNIILNTYIGQEGSVIVRFKLCHLFKKSKNSKKSNITYLHFHYLLHNVNVHFLNLLIKGGTTEEVEIP